MKVKISKTIKVITYLAIALGAIVFGLYLECCDKKEFMVTEIPDQTQLSTVMYETHYDDEGRLDINTATAEELTGLNGIGEVLAERIVEYREEHGRFTAIEELTLISGIGNSVLEDNKDRICVR